MTYAGQNQMEASSPKNLLKMKAKTRIGETIIYSGHKDLGHDHTQGVALMMTPEATKALMAWEPVPSRLMSARFNSRGRKCTIIQCYTPTNVAEEQEKENFYSSLQSLIDRTLKRDLKIIMGDLNAKVGEDNAGKEFIMGRHGIGICNENGELFTDLCSFNDLVIGGTICPHKKIHKTTWISPDGKTEKQIDHITVSRKWRSLLDIRVKHGADVASNHQLLVATMRVKMRSFHTTTDRPHHKFNVQFLRKIRKKEEFNCKVKSNLETVAGLNETPVETHWTELRNTWMTMCAEVLGKKGREFKVWLTPETWEKIEQRKS
ncbi:craniofacial development protein 2-like%2C partial [Xyrichtys novacula]|uniref:Craniofacial development protein 2-like, partial n=1 Tax=Xyrichtys novacula TaxID=13765 RepID=A0AAV1H6G5_XYRNO|nr:craniofacial development protein 2-like%2C partial [Xyrichtys novacula]